MMMKLLLGTLNQSKVNFYCSLLDKKKYELLTLSDFPDYSPIEEDLFDISGNSLRKATTYAKFSNLPTISDDTGVFIPALNNLPGVAARRWAGKLSADISDREWEGYFLSQINKLKPNQTECRKHKVVTLAQPRGIYFQEEVITYGKVLSNPKPKYVSGAPFSAYFFVDKFNKFESELDEKQTKEYNREAENKILELLDKLGI